jgi:hypothetical protein
MTILMAFLLLMELQTHTHTTLLRDLLEALAYAAAAPKKTSPPDLSGFQHQIAQSGEAGHCSTDGADIGFDDPGMALMNSG